MREEKILVQRKQGLHIRYAAALISKLQQHVDSSEELRTIWIEYSGRRAQVANLLGIVSLRIPEGASFRLFSETEEASPLVDVVMDFFAQSEEKAPDENADQLLIESSVSMEAAMASMRHGVLVVDKENRITYVNEAAAALIGKPAAQLHFKRASDAVPGSMMHEVLESGETQWNVRQQMGRTQIITNRAPIFYDNAIIGAVATFEDISNIESISKELQSVKLLQERLQLLVTTMSDAIALVDETGSPVINNRAFSRWLTQERRDPAGLLGKNEWHMLKTNVPLKKSLEGREGDMYVMKASPVFIEETFKGAVVSIITAREMKDIIKEIPGVTHVALQQGEERAFHTLTGKSRALREAVAIAQKAAPSDATIFISGESGTGKELLAQGIHLASPRRRKPFIAVNCASIPASLLESELFGHEKGAFTNAYRTHTGAFEQAEGGTLFLDEIAELSPAVQSKLLRVLQQREIVRVGGRERIPINIRILAATNRSLSELMNPANFREDLFYRLYVIPITLPPLRERREDIPILAEGYLSYYSTLLQRTLHSVAPEVYTQLSKRSWRGNVRELRNVMERMITLNETGFITLDDLPEEALPEEKKEIKTLQEIEKEAIRNAAPFYASYNQLGKALGVTHKTAARKLREYGLEHLLGQKEQIHRAK